jgi:metallo-beta-lactamase class B
VRIERQVLILLSVVLLSAQAWAQGMRPLTLQESLLRDVNAPREFADKQFPPHKIIGNLYYVGTGTLSSFLITTPQGHILINSTFERTVPIVRDSVQDLGFRFEDIKILLGSHAHGDHMEGDALIKQLTGATVMGMEKDIPALERMRPGGKAHPIDRVLRPGEEVVFGGMTLIAHHTPGHTEGNTSWAFQVQEEGKAYNVVIVGAMGGPDRFKLVENGQLTQVAKDFAASYKLLRSLPCDVVLGSHAKMYNMHEKFAALVMQQANGPGANPFIDPKGYLIELDNTEKEYLYWIEEQKKAAK